MSGQVKRTKEPKKKKKGSSKTIDIVTYALKVSIDGVTCVFVVIFRSKNIFKVCELA